MVLDNDGCVVVRVDEILGRIHGNPDMGSLILWLRQLSGADLSPLKPFLAVAAPTLAADELKRRNTDPAATACAQCGGALADPGMGPMFRHCPWCEP
jgi:hypothetical protein